MDATESPDWRQKLKLARFDAGRGNFEASLASCQQIVAQHSSNADAVLHVGALLLSFGFLSAARRCCAHVCALAPTDPRPVVDLANVAREAGDHAESRRLYALLLKQLPDHPIVRRNALVSLEYDSAVSDAERLAQAVAWGQWAMSRANVPGTRPSLTPLDGRCLRIGYVSADLCQHTVGLFVKDVLAAHDCRCVEVFVYSATPVNDWVTEAVRHATVFHDVRTLDDQALAALIRQDRIDVLVDLSGHTGGSRLTAFAHRPAPVQVSWLGYFATTGLPWIDAVILDDWHAPSGTEAQFVEAIVRLPGGRFCYAPVSFAPEEVAAPPCVANGYVTFGCFNNTAKLNEGVLAVWARILAAVPNSRLILKWRTFQDAALCQSIRQYFSKAGIDLDRLELRTASFHADVLSQYADVDIALDPFPFTGGLTSCEALWMGLPVVSWPQGRVVSRQTFAFLSAIGLPELAAQGADDYVRIAVNLAEDKHRLAELRSGMRTRMLASPLMDVPGFARRFEQALIDLYLGIYSAQHSSRVPAQE